MANVANNKTERQEHNLGVGLKHAGEGSAASLSIAVCNEFSPKNRSFIKHQNLSPTNWYFKRQW
jgi:hypothetical protein